MPLGNLAYWFQNTQSQTTKLKIIHKFEISKTAKASIKNTENTFHSLAEIRNICAHHGRLWNRHISHQAGVIKDIGMLNVNDRLLYNHLVVINHLMLAINSKNSTWTQRLITLLNEIGSCYYKEMGFPDDWREREPWKSNTP